MRINTKVKFSNSDNKDSWGFGKGIVMLLEGVEAYGSINKATKSMNMAYSKAWKIINAIEDEFQITLINRDGPRGSEITEEAKKMIAIYYEALEAAGNAAQEVFDKYY